MRKWAKDIETDFIEDNIKMANKYMRCSTTLITIMEILIKTTMGYHYIPM